MIAPILATEMPSTVSLVFPSVIAPWLAYRRPEALRNNCGLNNCRYNLSSGRPRLPRSRMTPKTVSASCISQTSQPGHHDQPVPLRPAARLSRPPWQVVTPATTTGTPSPWGSRPVGDPVVRLRCTYRARRRPPTHLLGHPRWAVSVAVEAARPGQPWPSTARRRYQASFRRVGLCTPEDWASSNPALAISRGPRGASP